MADRSDAAAAPPARKAAFGFIFAVALINSVSFGLMIPILPNLIKSFTGGDTAAASEWNVVFAVTWGLLQFCFAPILGVLSDRVGRRPVLLITLLANALGYVLLGLSYGQGLGLLFLARAIKEAGSAERADIIEGMAAVAEEPWTGALGEDLTWEDNTIQVAGAAVEWTGTESKLLYAAEG